MDFNLYTAASIVAALTLLTTLKLTLTRRVTVGAKKRNFILFHPLWLGALLFEVPYVVGQYLEGGISPWPVAAFTQIQDKAGMSAGILAGLAATTVDLWLFWTTATALLTFTQPMATAYEPIPKSMHKYFHLVNLMAGAFVIYKALRAMRPEVQTVPTEPKSTAAPFQPNPTKWLARFNAIEILAVLIGLALCSLGLVGAVVGVPIVLVAIYSAFFIPPKINRGLYIGQCPHCGADASATHYQTEIDCPSCGGDIAIREARFVALPKTSGTAA